MKPKFKFTCRTLMKLVLSPTIAGKRIEVVSI